MKNLFIIFYYPIFWIKFFIRLFFNSTELRILIFHDICPKNNKKFFNFIKYVQKSWIILDPDNFLEILQKTKKPKGRYLMISFDDGFKSNRKVANILQDKFKIKAIFFVLTDFIKINNINQSLKFAKKNLKNYDLNISNLTKEDLAEMIDEGHMVGSHTCKHFQLSELNKTELNNELSISKHYLEGNFAINCNNFAIPFGNIQSFNKLSVSEVKKYYTYIYTGLRGNNKNFQNNLYLKRDNIDLNNSILFNSLCIEGFFDLYYLLSNIKANKMFNKYVK